MPVIVVLAIGGGALWLRYAVSTRWRGMRRAPMIEDGPIPEPIRLILRDRSRKDDPALLNATVLELAETGVLRIDPADSQNPALVSPGAVPHASLLPDYQASVVARLLHRRGVSLRPVPLTALHPSEDPTAAKWYKEFHRQLRRAAADRGLLQAPASGVQRAGLFLGGLLTSELIADAISHYWHTAGVVPAVFFLSTAVTLGTMFWVGQVRPTAAGRAVLAESTPAPIPAAEPARSTRSARSEPESVPQPTAPVTIPISVLPNQLEPLPAHQVWSDYGGSWHPLDINTKETYAVRTGFPAFFLLAIFALMSMGSVLFERHDDSPINVAAFAVFGGLPVILLIGASTSLLRRRHLPRRAVIRGQVAKLWTVRQRGGENERTDYYCALDVGRGPQSVRLKMGTGLFGRLRVGEVVEVLVNPRRRSIKDIRFVGREN